jgi:hypothetical protein
MQIIYKNQEMCVSVWKYLIFTVHFPHVLATHVPILREVHYKGYIYQNITKVFGPMHRYQTLNIKHNTDLKYLLKIKMLMKRIFD